MEEKEELQQVWKSQNVGRNGVRDTRVLLLLTLARRTYSRIYSYL